MSFFLPWFLLKALCKKLRVKVLPRRPLIHVSGEVEQDQDLDAALKAIAAYIRSRNCGSICLMVSLKSGEDDLSNALLFHTSKLIIVVSDWCRYLMPIVVLSMPEY